MCSTKATAVFIYRLISCFLCPQCPCSCSSESISSLPPAFLYRSLSTPLFITINPPGARLPIIFFPSPSQVAILLFLIHLSPSDKEPVKNLSHCFVLEPVPRSLRPSFHPRGHSDILHSASLKIKHIKSSNGCFPSPPPSFHWGWLFSHLTHHYIQPLYSCPSEEEAEEGGGRGYSYRSHLHFISLYCLSFLFVLHYSRSLMIPALCVSVCVFQIPYIEQTKACHPGWSLPSLLCLSCVSTQLASRFLQWSAESQSEW